MAKTLTEMALREANACLLYARKLGLVFLEVLPCGTCGADETTVRRCPLPLASTEVSYLDPDSVLAPHSAVVTMLGCELLPARALLAAAAAAAANRYGPAVRARTRAVALLDSADRWPADPFERLQRLATSERAGERDWKSPGTAAGPSADTAPRDVMTLPASTRRNPAAAAHASAPSLLSDFVAPHAQLQEWAAFGEFYRGRLQDAVRTGLMTAEHSSPLKAPA
ncbi:hypothetical protein [Streptomyces prunicolor]